MTGISPTLVREADEVAYAAMLAEAQTAAREQAFTREMLALNAELSHALLRMHGMKSEPLRITRPGVEPSPDGVERLSMEEFASKIKRGEL